jgi:glutaredoxin 3
VDESPDLWKEMENKSGRSTVPQIFIDGNPVGGCDELFALESAGQLDKLLGIG